MSISYNNTTLSIIKYSNTELDKVIYDDTTVYQRVTVNYYCENSVYRSVKVISGNSVDLSSSNAASKSGWSFLGWRTDKTANGTVQSSIIAGTSTINLYAVYRATITLSYNGNGATSGSTASQTGYRYYNNGNITNPSFTLRSNGFARTNYKFVNWRLNSTSGTAYNAGANITLSSNSTMYAYWEASYNGPDFKAVSPELTSKHSKDNCLQYSTVTCNPDTFSFDGYYGRCINSKNYTITLTVTASGGVQNWWGASIYLSNGTRIDANSTEANKTVTTTKNVYISSGTTFYVRTTVDGTTNGYVTVIID